MIIYETRDGKLVGINRPILNKTSIGDIWLTGRIVNVSFSAKKRPTVSTSPSSMFKMKDNNNFVSTFVQILN